MIDIEMNISPDEKIAGVPLARLLRNLEETSYDEGSMDLVCRLTDCKAVIEELLQHRALASRPAEVDDEGLQFLSWCRQHRKSWLQTWRRKLLSAPSHTTNKEK